MRFLMPFICFEFFAIMLFGQIEVELYFKSDCDNSVNRLEFDLLSLVDTVYNTHSQNGVAIVPSKGQYLLTSSHSWAVDRIGSFDQVIDIVNSVKQVDTLHIPQIKFTWNGVLHPLHGSAFWSYFNCDKLCEGLEIDFYPNGKKRTEGEFKNGKPNHIIEYRENGAKEKEFWYVAGTQEYTRADYFNELGALDKYELYKRKSKRKTLVLTYTANGRKSNREIIRYTIVK